MRVLVTGATGFIGYHVARLLTERDFTVRALVRDAAGTALLEKLNIEAVTGDLRDFSAVCRAVSGCRQVYHLAADYRLWVPDPATMYAINVDGTRNVMRASLKLGVEKVVYTSTVGTLAAGRQSAPADEGTPSRLKDMVGHYKRSKFIAEQEVSGFVRQGLPAVIVNPSTPLGPMDRKPTPTGKMIVDFLNGRIPAYIDTGLNFVDVVDVAAGHLLASARGTVGQRYILGSRNLTLRQFFDTLAHVSGRKPPRIRLPYLPVLLAACVDESFSRFVTHRPPRIPLTGVRMAGQYMFFNCSKAVRELKMPQSPVEESLANAVEWFTRNNYIK